MGRGVTYADGTAKGASLFNGWNVHAVHTISDAIEFDTLLPA